MLKVTIYLEHSQKLILNLFSFLHLRFNLVLKIANIFKEEEGSPLHGTYGIRLQLRNRCSRKEQSLLFYLFKAFDLYESCCKLNIFFSEKTYFPSCVHNKSCPSNINTLVPSEDARLCSTYPPLSTKILCMCLLFITSFLCLLGVELSC